VLLHRTAFLIQAVLFALEAELASPKARLATEGDWPALAEWLHFASWRVSASITSRRSRPHFPG